MNFAALEAPMLTCYQSAGMNVLEHGKAVRREFVALRDALATGSGELPGWLQGPAGASVLARLAPDDVLERYQVYHDCGKPLCRRVDDLGRQHFPDHAQVSAQVWREHGGDDEVARLIEQDMDVHLLAAADVPEFAARPQAASLLLTAVAEVYANARMFGGRESLSFKTKWKHLERRGRAITKLWAPSS